MFIFRAFVVFSLRALTVRTLIVMALAGGLVASGQSNRAPAAPTHPDSGPPPAEDISGVYSFLHEGEFVQLTLEQGSVSGYISRKGEGDSDRGTFLDQFFSKASVKGHDVSFTTKPIHGVWFEFQGKFERGTAKSKAEDGYYILGGTLTEFSDQDGKQATRRSREVEFKWLAQPADEVDGPKPKKS